MSITKMIYPSFIANIYLSLLIVVKQEIRFGVRGLFRSIERIRFLGAQIIRFQLFAS